jgi:hypothetical protein
LIWLVANRRCQGRAIRHPRSYRQYWAKGFRGSAVFTKADIFILLGVAVAFVVGVYLFFTGEREQGIFVATWVPAILAFGIYFKLMRRKP